MAKKMVLTFLKWWLGTAAFLCFCYLLLYPAEWYMDWVFSGSLDRALVILLFQTVTIAAALRLWLVEVS